MSCALKSRILSLQTPRIPKARPSRPAIVDVAPLTHLWSFKYRGTSNLFSSAKSATTIGTAEFNVISGKAIGSVVVKTVPTSALPAEAGAQQQFGVAGKEFQHFDEVDRQGQRDRADGVVQEPFEIGLRERSFAELGERFLLLCAIATLVSRD